MASDLKTWIRRRNAQLQDAMQAELEAMIVEAKAYHQNAVRNWTKKPKWKVRTIRTRQELGAQLETTGDMREIFTYVNDGTGQYRPSGNPYWIFPKRPGGKLAFQIGYDAKTRPTAKANVGTGRRSGDWIKTDAVLHPGIEGREFSKTYQQRVLEPNFKQRIVKRVRRV